MLRISRALLGTLEFTSLAGLTMYLENLSLHFDGFSFKLTFFLGVRSLVLAVWLGINATFVLVVILGYFIPPWFVHFDINWRFFGILRVILLFGSSSMTHSFPTFATSPNLGSPGLGFSIRTVSPIWSR